MAACAVGRVWWVGPMPSSDRSPFSCGSCRETGPGVDLYPLIQSGIGYCLNSYRLDGCERRETGCPFSGCQEVRQEGCDRQRCDHNLDRRCYCIRIGEASNIDKTHSTFRLDRANGYLLLYWDNELLKQLCSANIRISDLKNTATKVRVIRI